MYAPFKSSFTGRQQPFAFHLWFPISSGRESSLSAEVWSWNYITLGPRVKFFYIYYTGQDSGVSVYLYGLPWPTQVIDFSGLSIDSVFDPICCCPSSSAPAPAPAPTPPHMPVRSNYFLFYILSAFFSPSFLWTRTRSGTLVVGRGALFLPRRSRISNF